MTTVWGAWAYCGWPWYCGGWPYGCCGAWYCGWAWYGAPCGAVGH
ncbi:hypothetical protein OHB41_03550 [Streptomyces sp. NBC_01571]|nr:hypothetical protein [Streptomyces sp. NBC_01571]MCX4572274.1 hypothetical protein [Streptomyces sp. NBC_01571]